MVAGECRETNRRDLIMFVVLLYACLSYAIESISDPVLGIDVSHHQKMINWDTVKGQRVSFAYIKATEGSTFKDSLFKPNYDQAKKAGVLVGAYHYFTFCSSARDQFRNFAQNAMVVTGDLPPAVDVEFVGNCRKRPSKDSLHSELRYFLEKIRLEYGVIPLIYTTEDFYERYRLDLLGNYHFWIRSIDKRPRIKNKNLVIWQYQIGKIGGIKSDVDLNIFLSKIADFNKVKKTPSDESQR
jgi:lysozyme